MLSDKQLAYNSLGAAGLVIRHYTDPLNACSKETCKLLKIAFKYYYKAMYCKSKRLRKKYRSKLCNFADVVKKVNKI